MILTYNESIEASSAENIENYMISPDIQLISVDVDADGSTVKLVTSKHYVGTIYNILVRNIWDTVSTPNEIATENKVTYIRSSFAGLVGYWNLDQSASVNTQDISGYRNDGTVVGATWQEGIRNSALLFDGIDDYVYIEDQSPLTHLTEDSFTFSAWVRPETIPTGNPYAIFLRVSAHSVYSFELSYGTGGRYRAQIITTDESFYTLTSEPYEPQTWHHVAMVLDMESHQLHLYVDGQAVRDSPMSYSGRLLMLNTEYNTHHDDLKDYLIENF